MHKIKLLINVESLKMNELQKYKKCLLILLFILNEVKKNWFFPHFSAIAKNSRGLFCPNSHKNTKVLSIIGLIFLCVFLTLWLKLLPLKK